jgi:uncharacterized flavoprotein (TIGR03862 family)
MQPLAKSNINIAIIGGGPSGLMMAENLSAHGFLIDLYERMPSVGRKFLMAGRGGLNLTHSEPLASFISRYGNRSAELRPMIESFTPKDLRDWADSLGAETFVGSSGRIFPKALKASPLLRAWLIRLKTQGVRLHVRHDWLGFDNKQIVFNKLDDNSEGETIKSTPDITILALGGASWPRLGANGSWVKPLEALGVTISPLKPANMGFKAAFSDSFKNQFAGQALKNIALNFEGRTRKGEIMITREGLEGGALYGLSSALRDPIDRQGFVQIHIDLKPDLTEAQITNKLSRASKSDSLSNRLRKTLGFTPEKTALLREAGPNALNDLPQTIKALPIRLIGAQGLETAISTAGGIEYSNLNPDHALRALPHIYVVGEMLDWEAPTGGYLLQACLSQAVWTAHKIMQKYQNLSSF